MILLTPRPSISVGGCFLGGWLKISLLIIFIVCFIFRGVRADTCRAGYVLSDVRSDSLITSFAGGCGTNSGYKSVIIADEFVYPLPDHITCGAGERYESGACVSNTMGDCDTGYVDSELNDYASFIQSNAGTCATGYQAIQTRQEVSYLTHRGDNVHKCAVGYYPTANGCVAYPVDNCPNNYYAVVPNTAYTRLNANDACNTNYSSYGDVDLCLLHMAPNIADICTPQLACSGGGSSLRTSTGVNLPLYGERVTTPSINVGFGGGTTCYVNMLSGAANNTINVKYNDTTYHGVN